MLIAFQGEPGAYSEAAAHNHFGPNIATLPQESFEAVFNAVESGKATHGLIPIENSLAGSIHQNYDLLLEHSLTIVGEHYLRVQHCLIAHPGIELSQITKIISHPQGLAQCKGYLRSLAGVQTEAVYDTAGSVKMIREGDEKHTAAIASHRAADVYQMNILAEGIEDNPANFTRFLAINKDPIPPASDAKTSIVFTLENQAGVLFKALSVFALRDIDLTKIESRPLVGKLWEYLFYIDFAGHTTEKNVKKALDHLAEYAEMLRVLGSYPRHRL